MRNFLTKLSKNRWLWTGALSLVLLCAIVPQPAYAWPDLFKLDDIAQGVISGLVFGLVWLLSMVAGVIIAIQSWFLQIVLSISFDLVNAAPVRIGFPIVLSVANLFFVGALIVIAIATIIRQEEYGVKKVLWKLVVMAVMVNFGLVICGALLRISDETTKFFIESISPSTSGPGGDTNYMGFANTIAGMFNPSGVILSTNDVAKNPALSKASLSFAAKSGDEIGNAIKPIVSVFAALAAFTIIIITLGTMIAMLLWRYVRLGMALIVLPLAWAAWIFPTYQEHYKKWWTKFTQWAIFPPVMVFFLWLSLKTSEVMSQQTGEYNSLYDPQNGTAIGNFLGSLFKPIISQTLKAMILWGIMMGGMVAAQELGVKFADAGYKAIEGAGGWAKDKAVHYGKRGAGAAGHGLDRKAGALLGKAGVQGTDKGISNWLAKSKSPILAKGGRALQGLSKKVGADVVTEAGKQFHAENDMDRSALLETGLELPEQLALLSKMDDLSKVKNVGGIPLAEWLEKNHQKIEDYQQHGLEKKLKDFGMTHGLIGAATGEEGDLSEEVKKAMEGGDPKMLAKLMKDGAGMGLDPTQAAILQKTIIRKMKDSFSPKDVADFTAGLGKAQLANFKKAVAGVVKNDEDADDKLGPEIAHYFRTNGGAKSRGVGSQALWGTEHPTETEEEIGTPPETATTTPKPAEEAHPKTESAPAATHTPAATTTAAPAAPTGDAGHGHGHG